ncbi:MAG: undecaprenyldiphospho-muramoylpentapeptide beta-N-acetylglucosaminyltransferase [Christensenellales bacterium]|jgi:UDP-N-acetylglucosamine--N-acetylmuramyl-(pentapeptide) pyrophosphoryl-undecaprenol N-acetylglucosamine transferase
MKKIILTGGGTAGHVTPNLALLPALLQHGYEVHYIGSRDGIEKSLCQKEGVTYHAIQTGKLRRYRSVKNFTDPFRILAGFFSSIGIIRRVRPNVIFSKGGFVSVPVSVAGKLNGIPVVLHESDLTPGLANRLCSPFSKAICATFPETRAHINPKKAHITGAPLRAALFEGDRDKGLSLCGFSGDKPVLLIIGGSLGAKAINNTVRNILPALTEQFSVIHLCGKGNLEPSLQLPHYAQFEFVEDELPHLFAAADIVLSRAGANAIFELLALRKPALLVPLTKSSSRGDQLLNAENFRSKGYSLVLLQEDMTDQSLLDAVRALYEQRHSLVTAMEASGQGNGTENVLKIIFSYAKPEKNS